MHVEASFSAQAPLHGVPLLFLGVPFLFYGIPFLFHGVHFRCSFGWDSSMLGLPFWDFQPSSLGSSMLAMDFSTSPLHNNISCFYY